MINSPMLPRRPAEFRARRASEPRVIAALEKKALGIVTGQLPFIRSHWRLQLSRVADEDGVLSQPPTLTMPKTIADKITGAMIDAQGWAGTCSYWFARWHSVAAHGQLRFDDRRKKAEARREAETLLPIGTEGVTVKTIVDGAAAGVVPEAAVNWFRSWEFDINQAFPEKIRDKARQILADNFEEGYTVRGAMRDLRELIGGDNLADSAVTDGSWLENVVRTNMTSMAQAGRFIAYSRDPELTGFEWHAIVDSRVCPMCSPLDGKIVSREAAEGGGFAPPLHFMCRCTQTPVYTFDQTPTEGAGELRGAVRGFMDELEAGGEFGDLGAASAEAAYKNFERMQEMGFGGKSVWEGLSKSGLV